MTTLGPSDNGQPQVASAAAVAGLAREVEALRKRLDPLSERVRDLARVVTNLAAEVGNLTAESGGLDQEAPTSWLALSECQDLAGQVLEQLVSWVDGVFLRYADGRRELPECWLWHPDIVEELLWLMQAWHAAYIDERASLRAAIDWHDRYRPGVVRRLTELSKNCSLDNHTNQGVRQANTRPEPVMDADTVVVIARWWGCHRGRRAPAPTGQQLNFSSARGEIRDDYED